ncbi:MAG: SCO family protein [Planctomycetes bacterium]|nr:SCO family protein [Planctomycetota bacterium]
MNEPDSHAPAAEPTAAARALVLAPTKPEKHLAGVILPFAMVLVAAVMVAGLWGLAEYTRLRLPKFEPLPRLGQAPAFSLTDRSGATITRDSLRGRIWVADFIFTRCSTECRLMSAQMRELQDMLRPLRDVALVSFTVDPEYDTPEVLSRYANEYQADPGKWLMLTGDRDALLRLSNEGFRLHAGEVAPDDAADPPPPRLTHSRRIVLVDRAAVIRAYYDGTEADVASRIRDDIQQRLAPEQPPR